MADRLGVCIVGAGDMGSKHAERWRSLPHAQVVAVVDIIDQRAERLARAHGLDTWHTAYQPAVSLPQVDVVSVCVPTRDHPDISIYAANHGKHVLCEKPIALTLAQAEAMIDAARRNGVKLGLGFMRRYSPVMADLKTWLAQGKLGRPVMYHAADVREIRPKREMHNQQANGGPVIDMGVHLFDGWSFIFDSPPEVVFAQGLTIGQNQPALAHIDKIAYDTAAITVRYASGDVGSFVVCWGLPPQVTPPGAADQMFCPGGLVEVQFGMAHQTAKLTRTGGEVEIISKSDQDMYQLEITGFARAILDNRPVQTPGEAGQAALRVALAAIESIQTGQPVWIA